MARITLEHPDLDTTIERDERSLPAWEATGWRRVDEPKPEAKSAPARKPRADTET